VLRVKAQRSFLHSKEHRMRGLRELETMKHRAFGTVVGVVSGMLLAGCAAEYKAPAEYEGDEAQTQASFGAAQEAVAACDGDSLQYDFNGFAASLATAIANEMKHWDVATDFVVTGTGPAAKLALSSTGSAICGTGCANVKDMLLTGTIPNHSPAEFRGHLVSWFNAEKARLVDLAIESRLPPGSYQFKNRNSGKNMVVDASSTAEGAKLEQGPLAGTAGNWTASVVGAKHKFVNVNSGKCMDLASASSMDNVAIVQKTCSTAATQNFDIVKVDGGYYAVKTTYGKEVVAFNWGTGNDVQLVQVPFMASNAHGNWAVNLVGGTTNPATTIFKGSYKLNFANTYSTQLDMNLVAAPISSAVGAQVKLASYSAGNMLHNWYAATVNGKYQFINRGSGKCLALATDSATALLVQKTCAVNDSQLFTATAQPYAEEYTLKTRYNTLLEVQNAGQAAGVAIAQTAQTQADAQRRVRFSPIQASEPHKLTFDHISNDAACGDYFWYNITQPSGAPLADPMNTYMHLIFAGGKTVRTGADANPFIAQMASGTQVAIDPSGFMTGGSTTTTGSCIASDVVYDNAKTSAGKCCIKYSGAAGVLVVSSWSGTTFLCQ
jgi:hypothetical protein